MQDGDIRSVMMPEPPMIPPPVTSKVSIVMHTWLDSCLPEAYMNNSALPAGDDFSAQAAVVPAATELLLAFLMLSPKCTDRVDRHK